MTAHRVQVVIDCTDPKRLAEFWAVALGYVIQPPPQGFDSWEAFLDQMQVPADQRDAMNAVVDPAGEGPRILFQKVPEPKVGKNRVHVDIHLFEDADDRWAAVQAHVTRLEELGAKRLAEYSEMGSRWVVCQDPEGNEFDVA